MGILLAIVGLGIAFWQLKLQRDEIQRNGKISSLIYTSSLLKDKIEHHEKIIQSQKDKKQDWTGHAHCVNKELRPLLSKVNNELINTVSVYKSALDISEIREALKLND